MTGCRSRCREVSLRPKSCHAATPSYWEERAAFSGAHCNLDFAVRRSGELVGVQGFSGRDYPVVRSVETGSWLVQRVQGHGIGTRMRQAVCAFLFDHLGAAEITSAAFADNPASRSVSRKVGYVPNGRVRLDRQGQMAVNERLLLTPEVFVRGVPIEVTGAEPLRRFLGVDRPDLARPPRETVDS